MEGPLLQIFQSDYIAKDTKLEWFNKFSQIVFSFNKTFSNNHTGIKTPIVEWKYF